MGWILFLPFQIAAAIIMFFAFVIMWKEILIGMAICIAIAAMSAGGR